MKQITSKVTSKLEEDTRRKSIGVSPATYTSPSVLVQFGIKSGEYTTHGLEHV